MHTLDTIDNAIDNFPAGDLATIALMRAQANTQWDYALSDALESLLSDECSQRPNATAPVQVLGACIDASAEYVAIDIATQCREAWAEYETQAAIAAAQWQTYQDAKRTGAECNPARDSFHMITRAYEAWRAKMSAAYYRFGKARTARDEAKQRALSLLDALDALDAATRR